MRLLAWVAAAAMLTGPAMAASQAPSAYDELRRSLEPASWDTLTALRLGSSLRGGSRADSPDPQFRTELDGLCGDKAAFRSSIARHLVEETREPAVDRPRGNKAATVAT